MVVLGGWARENCSGKDSENRNKGGGGGRVSQFWLIRGVGNDGAIKNYNGYLHANIYPRSV